VVVDEKEESDRVGTDLEGRRRRRIIRFISSSTIPSATETAGTEIDFGMQ